MEQIKLKKPSIIRRIISSFIDLFLSLILFIFLYSLIIQPLFYRYSNYKNVALSYYQGLEDTGLYTFDESNFYCTIVTFEIDPNEEVTAEDYFDYYDFKLEKYFSDNNQIELYQELKEKSKLFNEDFTLKDNVSISLIQDFYVSSINEAVNKIYLMDEVNKDNLNKINNYTILMILSTALPTMLLMYYVFPLLFDHGQTIGKKACNLKIASYKDGSKINLVSLLCRQSFIVFIVIMPSIFIVGIPLIIVFLSEIFQKDGRSFADLLTKTVVYQNSSIETDDNYILIENNIVKLVQEKEN